MSAEPSMEDILSSIKRIIADEGEPAPIRARRASRPARPIEPEPELDDDAAEVLELNDPMPQAPVAADPVSSPRLEHPAEPMPEPAARAPIEPAPRSPDPASAGPAIVSERTAAATRGSLEALSRMMVRPEPGSDGTLEGMVREMLRPMLAQWLDQNLPPLVEAMVEREIAKIVGAPRT